MLIRLGYEIEVECPQPTPIITMLEIHPDRRHDIQFEKPFRPTPEVETRIYRDYFGNICRRTLAPAGRFRFTYDAEVSDSGKREPVNSFAAGTPVEKLPDDTLGFLLGSRYCETDQMSQLAWSLFGNVPEGWARVQAVCDYVHNRIRFNYGDARATRTAAQAHEEQVGVCRDFAHLAITFCRCLNIPARYVNGYLGDIGVPADPAPMDFSAWFEAWIDGKWYTFDARHNEPRIGRVVVARGRDAMDVPLVHSFGQHQLVKFKVWTYEEEANDLPAIRPYRPEQPFQLGI